MTLDGHDPKIGLEDGAAIRYYVSHALGMLLHDENSYEFLAFYNRSILTEYSEIISQKDKDQRVHVKIIGQLLFMEDESHLNTSGCISYSLVCSAVLYDDTGSVSIDVATLQILICSNDSITTTPDLRIRHTLAGVPNSIQRTAGILYISTRYHTVFP